MQMMSILPNSYNSYIHDNKFFLLLETPSKLLPFLGFCNLVATLKELLYSYMYGIMQILSTSFWKERKVLFTLTLFSNI